MVGSRYVRPFTDPSTLSYYPNFGARGYRNQVLSYFESGLMLASHIEPGGGGPELHYHKVDQIYYMLHGGTNVQLGHVEEYVQIGAFVFIPAGLAHRNWNTSGERETHFEVITPTPRPSVPIVYPVASPDEVPEGDRTDRVGIIKRPGPSDYIEPLPGFRMVSLLGADDGSEHMFVNLAEVDPGRSGPPTHIHDFDQYYLVLEGELTVEVALHRQVVPPEHLIAIPAGVPHRMYNESAMLERHLVLIAPPPAEDSGPWDVGVSFQTTGVSFGP